MCMTVFLLAFLSLPGTETLQERIDRTSAEGGGLVVVSPGRHLVGQIDLRSNVELHLEKGAVLEGKVGLENYRVTTLPYSEGTWSAVVSAIGVTNVAITGEGEIFGNGTAWPKPKGLGGNQEGLRPRGVFFANCRGVRLRDFTLRDSACWGVVFKCCENVDVRRLKIDSHANANNDGIDVEAKNVVIADCDIDSGDDAVCLKSNAPDFAVENVLVTNVVARSHCNALKLGTASHGTMRNVLFVDCRTEAPRRGVGNRKRDQKAPGSRLDERSGSSAICVENVDGGIVEHVTFRNIVANGSRSPIFVRAGTRSRRSCGTPPSSWRIFRGIRIENVTGTSLSGLASSITGVPGCRVADVVLRNVHLTCRGLGDVARRWMETPVPEVAGHYPEAHMFGHALPAYGLYARHVDGLTVENCSFTLAKGEQDPRKPVVMEDVGAVAGGSTAAKSFSVVMCGGVPRLAVDSAPCVGTAAMPSPKVAPGMSVAALADFDRQGVRFYSDVWMMNDKRYLPRVWWRGEGDYDFGMFDALVRGLLDATQTGYAFPRIKLDPPESWIKDHPDEMFCGTVRTDSAAWRSLYRRMLRDMVAHVDASPYADRIAGYHLGALHCGEWQFHRTQDCLRTLPADPVARAVRSREIARSVSSAVVDAARFLRDCTHGRKLIGAFFGYDNYAHEDFFFVLDSGAVDFFAAPPCYGRAREPGSSGRSQAYYQASYRLHGSVYFEESDFRTFLSDPTCSFPPMTRMRPLGESLAIMRRSIGKCLAGGWENWWFLLGGNATFSAPAMLETVRIGVEEERRSLLRPWMPADVAVFTSTDEPATSVGATNRVLRGALKSRMQTSVLPSCGVTFDSYVLEDIANPDLPDYSVYFFPNAFSPSPEIEAAIRARTNGPGKTAIRIRAGDPIPDAATLREKFRAAGAHVWLESGDILATGRGYLMVHASSDGEKAIRLPTASDVHEIFGAEPDRRNVMAFVERLRKGETRVYRLDGGNKGPGAWPVKQEQQ